MLLLIKRKCWLFFLDNKILKEFHETTPFHHKEWKNMRAIRRAIFSRILKEFQSLSDLSIATAMNSSATQTPLTVSCNYVKHYSLQTNRLECFHYMGTFKPKQFWQVFKRFFYVNEITTNWNIAQLLTFSLQGLNILNKVTSQTQMRLIRCSCCTLQCEGFSY